MFILGPREGFAGEVPAISLANNATKTLDEGNPAVLAAVYSYVEQGVLQILSGPYALSLSKSAPRAGSGYVGATGNIVAANTVTIGSTVFEWNTAADQVTAGRVWAGVAAASSGTAAATALENFRVKLLAYATANTSFPVTPGPAVITNGSNSILPLMLKTADGTTTVALAVSGTNLVVSAANTAAGSTSAPVLRARFNRTVTAAEVTQGVIAINTGLSTIGGFSAQLRVSGVVKVPTGAWSTSGSFICLKIDSAGGAVNPAAGDVIEIDATGTL